MYVFHKDIPNNQWNVFKIVGGREEFICAFDELEDARDFCKINNGVLEATDASAN